MIQLWLRFIIFVFAQNLSRSLFRLKNNTSGNTGCVVNSPTLSTLKYERAETGMLVQFNLATLSNSGLKKQEAVLPALGVTTVIHFLSTP